MAKYIQTVWATTGLKTAIPEATVGDGSVSYPQGWGTDYEQDPVTNPTTAKFPELRDFNQLFSDITENIKQSQENSFPTWIADAGSGTPFSYGQYRIVEYTDNNLYISLVNTNTEEPTAGSDWQLFNEFASGLDINGLTAKTTPVSADELVIADSAATFGLKKLTWSNLIATLPLLGIGQTWQDVSASRSVGVIETNNTTSPIMVNVTSAGSTNNQLEVDGLVVGVSQDADNTRNTISAVVPIGSTYEFNGASITDWVELRA